MLISGTGTVAVDQAGDTHDVKLHRISKSEFCMDSTEGELVVTSGLVSVREKDLTTGENKNRSVPLGKGALMALPGDSTGDWNLTLNLKPPNKAKYSGTATIETSTGGTTEFTATGIYSAKTDTSEITLKGAGGSLTLVISTSGSSMGIHSAKDECLKPENLNFKSPCSL